MHLQTDFVYSDYPTVQSIHCYNNLMAQTLQSLADFTATRLIGDGNLEIATVASIAQAQPGRHSIRAK